MNPYKPKLIINQTNRKKEDKRGGKKKKRAFLLAYMTSHCYTSDSAHEQNTSLVNFCLPSFFLDA